MNNFFHVYQNNGIINRLLVCFFRTFLGAKTTVDRLSRLGSVPIHVKVELTFQLVPIDIEKKCLLIQIRTCPCQYLVDCVFISLSTPKHDFLTIFEHLLPLFGGYKLLCFVLGTSALILKKLCLRRFSAYWNLALECFFTIDQGSYKKKEADRNYHRSFFAQPRFKVF